VAARNGHSQVCTQLLAGGAAVNAKDQKGLTALKWAMDGPYRKGPCVKVLEDVGGVVWMNNCCNWFLRAKHTKIQN
jgi:ankyrin repeat protein